MRLKFGTSQPMVPWTRRGADSPEAIEKRLSMAESGRFMKRYEEALEGYTYLTLNE